MFSQTLKAVLTACILIVGASGLEAKYTSKPKVLGGDLKQTEVLKNEIIDKKVNYFYSSYMGEYCEYLDSTNYIREQIVDSIGNGGITKNTFIEQMIGTNGKYHVAKFDQGEKKIDYIFADTLENCQTGMITLKKYIEDLKKPKTDNTPITGMSAHTFNKFVELVGFEKAKELTILSSMKYMSLVEEDIKDNKLLVDLSIYSTLALNDILWVYDIGTDTCSLFKNKKDFNQEKFSAPFALPKTSEFVFGKEFIKDHTKNIEGTEYYSTVLYGSYNSSVKGNYIPYILADSKQNCITAANILSGALTVGIVIPVEERTKIK